VRISIKIKFSLFLAALLLLTVFILSLLVLRGIKTNQVEQYEKYLARQMETANVYFKQSVLAESNKIPQIFLNTKGVEFAKQLELLTGQSVVLYDLSGEVVSRKVTPKGSEDITETLEYALEGKTAYLVEEEELFYLAPLRIGNEQVGVIRFYYSLTGDNEFYGRIRQTFITLGTVIFLFSFILAYFYFNSFANGIIKLEQMVDRVRRGHFEITIFRRRDEIGRLSVGIHAMSSQIMSTMKDMEEEQEKLTLAVNKLSLLDQQQKQFIGNVTHEFKTPLTSIKAYIDLLEMYPDDDELKETAKINIKSETNRLYEMVDKVLQLSILEKYDFEYNPEKIDIKQITLSVLQSLSGKMNKFGIQLKTELTGAYVKADKDSIVIILINLLDNAIKYNKINGKVFVKNYIHDNRVFIEITDTGIGIPKEAVTRIFDPFYTVDKNRSRESGGAGLGLSLVKKYTDKMGGSITLINSDVDGTTFRISFPESQAE
jgi:two-component system, OmpR family, phosphate regulon sensor histidine kinase PhoR